MAETRTVTNKYNDMVQDLLQLPALRPIKDQAVTIIFLESDYKKMMKGKKVCGLTEKVGSKHKWAIPADFTITIYTQNIQKFTDEQVKILLEHELMHIGVDEDRKMYVKPHDLEDFREIIDKYGAYWDATEFQ